MVSSVQGSEPRAMEDVMDVGVALVLIRLRVAGRQVRADEAQARLEERHADRNRSLHHSFAMRSMLPRHLHPSSHYMLLLALTLLPM